MTQPFLSLIVPTYNEKENLVELVDRVMKLGYDLELIIVDDCSPDGTGQLAEQMSEKEPRIRVTHRSGKLGLASAAITGFNSAKAEWYAVMDADLQHPPEVVASMILRLQDGFELVVGSRYIAGGGTEDWNFTRKMVSRMATLFAHLLVSRSRKVSDPMSGYFALNRRILRGVKLNPSGYKILLEILAKAKFRKVTEVPYVFVARRKGASKLGSGEILAYLRLLKNLVLKK
jgi:dolichol-phosphate mannosyltransferase